MGNDRLRAGGEGKIGKISRVAQCMQKIGMKLAILQ
jgi:hypothetical protein